MAINSDESSGVVRLELQPNSSLGWPATKRVLAGFALLMTLSGAYWAIRGAWLVLPFFGLELLVLAGALYLNALACNRRELILIDGPELRILSGGRCPREIASLPRDWTRVVVSTDPSGWYQSRLWLACHGRRLEIGAALVEQERLELAAMLNGRLQSAPSIASHRQEPVLPGIPATVSPARRESTWQQ